MVSKRAERAKITLLVGGGWVSLALILSVCVVWFVAGSTHLVGDERFLVVFAMIALNFVSTATMVGCIDPIVDLIVETIED